MNKKTYEQPSMKAMELEGTSMLDYSNTSPKAMSLFDEEVDEDGATDGTQDIWGIQF